MTVDLEGPEDGDDVELTLTADGKRALFFDDWKVDEGGLAREVTLSVPESSTSVEANGVAVEADGGEDTDFWALPATYVFNPYGDNPWLEAGEEPTSVPATDTFGVYAETVKPGPSDQLREKVDTAIADWVNGRMEATELSPDDCPQDAFGSGDKQRKVVWTLTTMPTVSWDYFDGNFPVDLSSDVTGEATVTYEYDASYGFGTPEWTKETEQEDLYVNATVDLVDGEPVVTFESVLTTPPRLPALDDRLSRPEIDVVGAVIVRDGLVLCAERGPDGSLAGRWEFPGGKVEHGESGRLALAREIDEELQCVVEVGDEIATTRYDDGRVVVVLTTFWCRIVFRHATADRALRAPVGRTGRAGRAGLGTGRRTGGGAGPGRAVGGPLGRNARFRAAPSVPRSARRGTGPPA